MTENKQGLALYLPFSESAGGMVHDASGNGNHGVLSGAPKLVDDPFFGAALELNGEDQFVTVANDAALQVVGNQTIEMWLRPSALGQRRNPVAKAYGGEGTVTLESDGRLTYYYGMAGRNASPYQGVSSIAKLVTDEWAHLAVVRDLTAKSITWYVNGTMAARSDAVHPTPRASSAPILIGRGYVERYAGAIAHLRLYARALTGDEILLDIDDDRTAVAAFRMTHPISFHLGDQDEQDVLAIRDGSNKGSYHLEVRNDTRRQVRFKASGSSPGDATADNSLFELVFRPGTLTEGTLEGISVAEPGWTTGHTMRDSGSVSLLLYPDEDVSVAPGGAMKLTLENVSVSPGGGSRGTRILLRYRGLEVGGGQPMSGHRVQHLSVVNERGRRTLPVHFGCVGPSSVVNDGTSENTLTLRVTNTMVALPGQEDRATIRFNPPGHARPSKLVLSFVTEHEGEVRPWAIASTNDAAKFEVKCRGESADMYREARTPRWVIPLGITELAPGQWIDIPIGNIVTDLQAGPTPVSLHYENVAGYREGTLQTDIHKSPLLFSNDTDVGVATKSPLARLHVAGGALRLDSGREIFFADNGQIRSLDDNHRILFRRSENKMELREFGDIYFSPGATSGRQTAKVTMKANGNVGLGTTGPGEKLDVRGTVKALSFKVGSTSIGDRELKALKERVAGATLRMNAGKEVFFADNGQIRSMDNNHRILFRRSENKMELREFGDICFSPGATRGRQTAKVTMKANGNVGLGTTGPGEKLDVRGTVKASSFKVGGTSIGEKELKILKKLAAGTLVVDIYNTDQKEYMYAADYKPFDSSRRRVFTWRKGTRVSQGYWRLRYPR